MSKLRILLCGLAVTCSLAIAATAQSALNVKTGLWENTISMKMSGYARDAADPTGCSCPHDARSACPS